MTRVGVVTFPGSLDDHDALRAVQLSGAEAVPLWHASDDLGGVDAVILPGGFSYGDYLRCGAISRFSPVMDSVIDAAHRGIQLPLQTAVLPLLRTTAARPSNGARKRQPPLVNAASLSAWPAQAPVGLAATM